MNYLSLERSFVFIHRGTLACTVSPQLFSLSLKMSFVLHARYRSQTEQLTGTSTSPQLTYTTFLYTFCLQPGIRFPFSLFPSVSLFSFCQKLGQTNPSSCISLCSQLGFSPSSDFSGQIICASFMRRNIQHLLNLGVCVAFHF